MKPKFRVLDTVRITGGPCVGRNGFVISSRSRCGAMEYLVVCQGGDLWIAEGLLELVA